MSAAAMRVCVLGSGSSGNCTVVEGPGGIVLLDVGFSPRETRRRMESAGFRPADVGAVVLTHPDSDHLHSGWTRALGGLAGPRLVVRPRHAAAVASMGYLPAWVDEEAGAFERCGLSFEAFPLPHDSLGSTAFRIRGGTRVAAHATDCGRATRGLAEFLAGADVLLLESNYDPPLQRASGRSPYLIDRIMGGSGHLSNEQALSLAVEVDRLHPLGAVVLLHLSRQCNCPSIVERLWTERAPALAPRLVVSGQHAPTRTVEVAARVEHATLFDA
ncbi:MAG: MBL fold metallo-hydrolase [Phycisphaerales bacterium]